MHGFQWLGLWIPVVSGIPDSNILGDPGADSGGEGKSKRAEKYGTKKSKERRENLAVLYFSSSHISLEFS